MRKMMYGIIAVIVMVAIAVMAFYILNNSPSPPIHYSSKNATNVTNGINNFAFKAYSELNAGSDNGSTNIFFSPFSVYTAMSMVAEGAGGNTASQMHDVLGLSPNSSDNHAGFGLYLAVSMLTEPGIISQLLIRCGSKRIFQSIRGLQKISLLTTLHLHLRLILLMTLLERQQILTIGFQTKQMARLLI
ncbi:MAG: hypothetical protein KGH72_02530 [Candidatus Micrarchaeota archaeon]|nr:hypothetical protein [Candidatus Micrarchaeota archaeon]